MINNATLPEMVTSIADAKAHFTTIVNQASTGKVFIICRDGHPIVTVTQYVEPSHKRQPDTLRGKISIADDFDAIPEGFAER